MANETANKKERLIRIHSLIGVGIMILFRFLPLDLPEVTPVGMEVLGIFIGTLYLWTFVDPLWGSLISIAMVGISNYMPMPALLKEALGAPVLGQVFFMLILAGALVYYKITIYIGRFFLTRKITNGKPWLLAFVIGIGCYFLAGFISPFTSIFLFWPVLYDVFNEVGYQKGDDFPRILLTLVVVSALIGFPMAPFAQNGLALLSNFTNITANLPEGPVTVNNAVYMVIAIVIGFIMMAANILYSKYVLRPDVSKLKNYDVESLNRHPLPPMDSRQKIICAGFVILIVLMLLPSLIPSVPGMAFLSDNSLGLALLTVAVLAAVRVKGGTVLEIHKIMASNFNWGAYFIIAAAMLLGSVLTSESTGISGFLKVLLSPVFEGMSPVIFTVLLMVLAGILTNLCNSLVIGMILQPIIVTYCIQSGAKPAPIVTMLIIFVLLSAAVTPASSPFAAVLHSNKEWVPTKYVYQYTIPYVIIELIIVMIIGIPLANLLM